MNVIIIGGGNVGTYLAELLVNAGHEVRVIERSAERAQQAQRTLSSNRVINGDGTDPSMLEAAAIRTAQVVAAVTGVDETNLVVTCLARFAFGVRRTIARVNNPHNAWMFTAAMGVDVPLNQATLLAHLITEEMELGDMQTLLKLRRGQYALVEEHVHPTALAVGRQVQQLDLPEGCTIVVMLRDEHVLTPQPDLVLQAGDQVFAVVHTAQQKLLAALLSQHHDAPLVP